MQLEFISIFFLIAIIAYRYSLKNSKKPFLKYGKSVDLENANTPDSIFYHEDDYHQVEIIPVENFDKLILQADNIDDFQKKNSSGSGYSDILIRDDNEYSLSNRKIECSSLKEILSQLPMRFFEEVTTGIQPGEIECETTNGFGENYRGIFFDFNSNYVNSIWIAGYLEIESQELTNVLNQIGEKWNLLLMDWSASILVDLKNPVQIQKYLKEH